MSRGYFSYGRRWSKIKKKIEDLFDENLNLQIHCTFYTITTKHFSFNSPRYWLVLDKEIIFDFPGQFFRKGSPDTRIEFLDEEGGLISSLLQCYVELPRDQLLTGELPRDRWGVADILRAADRRIGKNKLQMKFQEAAEDSAVKKIIMKRFSSYYLEK